MAFCRNCGLSIQESDRFCGGCGAPAGGSSSSNSTGTRGLGSLPVEAADLTTPLSRPAALPLGRTIPSGSEGRMGFTPGQVLLQRFRVIGLLGKGGMGEVYRADDLKLGQPVALKFLPRQWGQDPALVERFYGEVRNARQVAHPNVCRVYDVYELEGQHFLSMEYVDGEDLSTLLRRIGHLPAGKANEIARQICAGLAAAHDRGLLHRDLKPANIMIDGHGRAKLTDFGLAVSIDDDARDLAGTPAYMAPEQFEGKPVSTRTDVYALGLILYEIYTGERPFEAASVPEWRSRHTESMPTLPSDRDRTIEEAVERVILRCLEKDPSKRPASALQVASALPGGDPLAAALAAGETPSPEMVAAAGGEGTLSRRTAWVLFSSVCAVLALTLLVMPHSSDLGIARFDGNAAVLRERATHIADRFGYGEDRFDSESWYERAYDPLLYFSSRETSTRGRERMRTFGVPLYFVYRQSPHTLLSVFRGKVDSSVPGRGGITQRSPALDQSGMLNLVLFSDGSLLSLEGVPAQFDSTGGSSGANDTSGVYDWAPLFQEAGLDPSRFAPRPPRWTPAQAFDQRAEWTGVAPTDSTIPLTVSAAAYAGRPVHFEVLGPWSHPTRMVQGRRGVSARISEGTRTALFLVGIVFLVYFSRRNLRLGRVDRRGAYRMAALVFWTGLAAWVAGGHHTTDLGALLSNAIQISALGVWQALLTGMFYFALEPYFRRQLPDLLIGWTRATEGRFDNPRVGRDVLIGFLLGSLLNLSIQITNAIPGWFPIAGQTPVPQDTAALYGGRRLLATLLDLPGNVLTPMMICTFGYFLIRVWTRRARLALVATALLFTLSALGGENFALETAGALFAGGITAISVARFGLLTHCATWFFLMLLLRAPLPLEPGTAHFSTGLVVLGGAIGLLFLAFRRSMGAKSLFTDPES